MIIDINFKNSDLPIHLHVHIIRVYKIYGFTALTYSCVTLTPPSSPLEKTPLPLPPARIWAFTTTSFTPAVRQQINFNHTPQMHAQQKLYCWQANAHVNPQAWHSRYIIHCNVITMDAIVMVTVSVLTL